MGEKSSTEKYRAKKVDKATGDTPNLNGVSTRIKNMFKRQIDNAQFLMNKYHMIKYGYFSKYAISPKQAYSIRLVNCRVRSETLNTIFCQILIVSDDERQYSFEPSLGSQDGEFRGRVIAQTLFNYMIGNPQFPEIRDFAKKFANENNLQLNTEYFGPHHQKDELAIDNMIFDLLGFAIIVATHTNLTNTDENHRFASYDKILVNSKTIEFYNKIQNKYKEGHFMFLRSYFNPKKGFFGRKLLGVTLRETVNPENIMYPAWREYYVAQKCNDLILNEISYSYPYCMDWIVIQNVSQKLYDNPAMLKRYDHSIRAGEIIEQLSKVNLKNYMYEGDAGGRIPLSTKFLKLSNHIENAMNYAESYIFLSDIALCLHTSYCGRTFRDIPQLILNQKENLKKFPNTYDVYHPDIFEDCDVFFKILFDYIYGIHNLHDKLKIIHGDLHLNNITLQLGGSYGRFLEKNKEKDFISLTFLNDDTYMFKATEYIGCIIDFSRSIIANNEMLDFDFDKEFRSKFLKEQEPRIISLIGHYLESVVKTHYNSLRAIIVSNMKDLFPILTALDYYVLARSMNAFFKTITNIKIDPKIIEVVRALQSFMLEKLSTGIISLINGKNVSSEFPIYEFLDNYYSDYKIPSGSSKIPAKFRNLDFSVSSVLNNNRGIDYTSAPPNMPPELDEKHKEKILENYRDKSLIEFGILNDKNARKLHEFSLSQSWKLV